MPVSDAKEMILRTSAKELLKYRPSWLKDCVCHRNSADSYFRCYGVSEKNFFINFLML